MFRPFDIVMQPPAPSMMAPIGMVRIPRVYPVINAVTHWQQISDAEKTPQANTPKRPVHVIGVPSYISQFNLLLRTL